MRFKGTYILLATVALLGLYLYFVELKGAEKREAAEAAAQRLFSFAESDITEIAITGVNGSPMVLQVIPGHPDTPYLISEPINTVADKGVVSGLIFQLTHLKSTQTVDENPSDLTPFGLDPPAHSVQIHLQNGNRDLLLVGDSGITGQGMYAQVGKTVYLIEGGLGPYFEKVLDDWRRKELFGFAPSSVKAISLEQGQDIIALAKEGEKWMLKPPPLTDGESRLADPAKVLTLLGKIASLRGEGFIDTDKEAKIAEWGTPVFQVKLGLEGIAEEAAFYNDINEPDSIYVVTTPKAPIYKISADRLDEINQPVTYFMPEEKKESVDKDKESD